MSGDNFWLSDESGLPESFIDAAEFTELSRRIIDHLLAVATNSDSVAQVICDEIMAFPGTEAVRLLLAATVVDNLMSGVVAPIIESHPAVRASIAEHLQQRRATGPTPNGALAPEGDPHV